MHYRLCLMTLICAAPLISEELSEKLTRVTNRGDNALHLAIRKQNPEEIELAIAYGFDLNQANKAGDTPLHIAASKGDLATCRLLIDRGASPKNINLLGQSPYHAALKAKQEAVIQFFESLNCSQDPLEDSLIAAGLQPHLIDNAGNTWIHRLVKSGDSALLAKVMECPKWERDLLRCNKKGESPFRLAIKLKSKEILDLYLPLIVGHLKTSDLCLAARLGWHAGVEALLDLSGIGIDTLFSNGETSCNLLHFACFSGDIETVQLLLERGASVNLKTTSRYQQRVLESDFWSPSDWDAFAEFSNGPICTIRQGGYLYPVMNPLSIALYFHPEKEDLHKLLKDHGAINESAPSIRGERPDKIFN